jgi:aryl-alcohol dehydrogenase-like predicted oxidoreductase
MLYRALGRTGERISAIGLGGFHIGKPSLTDDDSIRLIHTAIDRGITFMDDSLDYHEGQSEVRMGKALKDGHRQKVFLMTKIDGRTKETAARQIETDHIDLLQHHEVIRFDDPTEYSPRAPPRKPLLKPSRLERYATSHSLAIKIRACTFTC